MSDGSEDGGAGDDIAPVEAGGPAQVVAFSLTPATSIGGVIDYATSRGRKLYAAATAKLEDEPFDCVAEDLYSFLKALKDRAREFGWDDAGIGILSIPDDPVNPTEFKSLIDQHGEIELDTIRAFEESYGNGTTAILTLVESAMAYGASTFHPSVKEKSTDLIRNLIQKLIQNARMRIRKMNSLRKRGL